MTPHMAALARCIQIAGLRPGEVILGVSPSERHERLFEQFALLSPTAARTRIVAEIRMALAENNRARAADLLLVLRVALSPNGPMTPQTNSSVTPRRLIDGSRAVTRADNALSRTARVTAFEARNVQNVVPLFGDRS